MRSTYDPYGDEEPADLRFPFSPDAPIEEQIANLIFRFSEYRKVHRHIRGCLDTVSAEHYKVCNTKTLIDLKQPIQVFLYAREALEKIDEALEKDIIFCTDYLLKLQEKIENG